MTLAEITDLTTLGWTWVAALGPRLLAALVILVVGLYLAALASKGITKLAGRARGVDPTIVPVLAAAVRYGIIIFTAVAALSQAGIATTSVLAVLGAAGLALGLALQGTLSNIAAGIMLLWLRPFRVGDYIEVPTVAGTVEEISVFHSRLRSWDGFYKFVPNAQLWNTTLTNYTRNRTRLILIEFSISYDDDIANGRRVLSDYALSNPDVLRDPPVQVVPLSLADSSVVLQLRAWTTTAKFWETRWDLTQGGKAALEAAGLTIPFPQQVVHWASPEAIPPPAPPGAARS
jgi:small conductance mechanosensitive channel